MWSKLISTVSDNTIPSLRDESDFKKKMEINAYWVQEDVAAFTAEPPIQHNIYLDSETDTDPLETLETSLIFQFLFSLPQIDFPSSIFLGFVAKQVLGYGTD